MPGGSLLIDDYSGGLNLRDSPNQLKPSESPLANNWTLDQRGGLKRRKGHTNVVALPGVSGTKADIFYSAALDLWLCARETSGAPNTLKLHTRPGDLSGSWTDRGTINSDVTARAAFIDFPGNPPLVVIATDKNGGATKGTWTYNAVGPALAQATGGANIAGTWIALWQDRAIVGGYPTSDANGNPTRFFATAPKAVDFSTGWNNDVRELNADPLTAAGVVGGALVIFKKRSHYRVNDSATGSYTTIDTAAGCVNARALARLRGRLYAWGADGMYESDGVGALKIVGARVRPLHTNTGTDQASIVAGVFEDRVIFGGQIRGLNELVEFDPLNDWAIEHTFPNAAQDRVTSFASKEATLYGAIVDGDDLFSMFTATAGADDATGYTSTWVTPWLLPNSGMLARLHRLRVQGLVDDADVEFSVQVFTNWNPGSADFYALQGSLFSTTLEQAAADVQSAGHGSAFRFTFTVADTATGNVFLRALQLIDQSLAWPSPGYPELQKKQNYNRDRSREGGRTPSGQPPDPRPNQ